MRAKIGKRSVTELKAPTEGQTVLWDTEVKGFGVRVRAGGTRTYIVRYRPGAGGRTAPLRTYTIGQHGSPWTPDEARIEAKRILGLVEDGNDPAADLSAKRLAPSVQELGERFLREHAEAKRKQSTADEYARLIKKHINPAIGRRKVADVTRQEVIKLHNGLRETPYQANRVLAVIRKMFNLAEDWGLRPSMSNPSHRIEPFKEHSRERMLSVEELFALGNVLSKYEGNAFAKAAFQLLILTGARLSEVLSLRWEWIDFERGEARLPDSKTGAKTLQLPPPALQVLQGLKREKGNPFVIVGAVEGASLVNLQKPWRAVRRAAAAELLRLAAERGPDDLERAKAVAQALASTRLHDLRHTFASTGAASGLSLPIIGKMLGHSQPATTARYAHLAADPVKAAAASVAGKIASAMKALAKSQTPDDLSARRRGRR